MKITMMTDKITPNMLWLASLVAQMVKRPAAMQETRVQSLGQEDPLEKEMATHSSSLAWRIPRTEEVGGLQSMGSQRVDRTERLSTHTQLIKQLIKVSHQNLSSTLHHLKKAGQGPLFPFHRLERWGEGSCVRAKCLPRVSGTLDSSLSAGSVSLPVLHRPLSHILLRQVGAVSTPSALPRTQGQNL